METLVHTIAVPLTVYQAEKVERIDREDFDSMLWKVSEELSARTGVVPDQGFLEQGVLALKQYYAVALLDPKNRHAVSASIDPFWHAHILHTRQYLAFCDEVFGQYVHHDPLDRADTEKFATVHDLYVYTSRVYDEMFLWVDRGFFPVVPSVTDVVCMHYDISDPQLRKDTVFPVRMAA